MIAVLLMGMKVKVYQTLCSFLVKQILKCLAYETLRIGT